MPVRSSKGGPELPVENAAFIQVDIDGVPVNVSGGGTGISVSQTTDAVRDALKQSRYIFATARSSGNGYLAGEKVIIFFGDSGNPVSGYNTDAGNIIPSITNTAQFITGVGDIATSMAEALSSITWQAVQQTPNYDIGDILFLKKDISGLFVWCVVNSAGQVSVLNTNVPASHRKESHLLNGTSGFIGFDKTTNHNFFVSTIGGVPQKVFDLETRQELPSIPSSSDFNSQKNFFIGVAKKSGTGYSSKDQVRIELAPNGAVLSAYNIDTASDITPLPPAKDFSYSTLESVNNNPKTPFIKFRTFTIAKTEQSIPLDSVKSIDIFNIHKVEVFFGWRAGATRTINCCPIQPSTYYFAQTDINFTGDFVLSVSSVPTPTVISQCKTVANSAVIEGMFSAVFEGQIVTGPGIPTTTNVYVKNKNPNSQQITLCDATGITEVNAIASSDTAQLTFSGAVVKTQAWS